mmetsp:Transcript_4198/g.4922  ORF Transcript_4198/g.4922 Transcript_4198/m.4922 type:complete len:274 (-) Transcript_4198:1632-2453(-)
MSLSQKPASGIGLSIVFLLLQTQKIKVIMKLHTISARIIKVAYAINHVLGYPVTEDSIAVSSIQNPLHIDVLPNVEDGARVARTLVSRESLVNVNTFKAVKTGDEHARIPVSSMEYYSDCDGDGDPYWLVVDIGSTFRNIEEGSDYTFTIRMGDHPLGDEVDTSYPGSIKHSPAGSPRINLRGKLENVTFENPIDQIKLEACFLKRHPDAKAWLPRNKVTPHKSHWVKFVVDEVYMVGGFGNLAYIGTIDGDIYHKAELIESSTLNAAHINLL